MSQQHVQALEWVKAGDWEGAHDRVQSQSDTLSSLIHGYLHREEGDLANAGYWYRRAGEALPDNTLEQEWERLMDLARGSS